MGKKVLTFLVLSLLHAPLSMADIVMEQNGSCDPCLSSAGSNLCCDWGVGVEVDWLYWKPLQSNLDYTLPYPPQAICEGNPTKVGKGRVRFMEYDWNSGIRVGLDKRLCCDEWNLKAIWTHWDGDAEDSASLNDSNLKLAPLLYHPGAFESTATRAKGKMDLDYNVFDLLVRRSMCITQNLGINPFVGLRYAKIDQNVHVRYSGGDFDNASGDCFVNGESKGLVNWKSTVHGLGLHLGFDADYCLCGGFSLVGRVGGSLLAARTREHQRQRLRQLNGEAEDNLVDLREREWIGLPGLDLFLGVRYQSEILCNCVGLTAQLGWEFTQWWDLPRIRRWVDDRKPYLSEHSIGNGLQFQGLTARLGISF